MTRSRTERLALTALFTAAALVLSYIEALLPFELIIPIPGFKLGLANLAVAAAFFMLGAFPALGVSLCRIFLNFLLFGSLTSLWFSLAGGLLSYMVLVIWKRFFARVIGIAGLSVMSAAMHNLGQCIAAWFVFGWSVIAGWLPLMLIISLITGTVTGVILYFAADRLMKLKVFSSSKKGIS